MGCCTHDGDAYHDLQEMEHTNKYPAPGLQKKRVCRDLLCLVFFVVFWVGMIVVAIFGFAQGDPDRLIYGDDYQGNVCGRDNTKYPVIVDGLAKGGFEARDHSGQDLQYFILPYSIGTTNIAETARICVNQCPPETIVDPARINGKLVCTYEVLNSSKIAAIGSQCFFPYASSPLFNRCVPDVLDDAGSFALEELNAKPLAEEAIAAIYAGQLAIGLALVGAFVLGFLWLIVMRFFAGITIWFTVWAAILTLLSLALIMYLTADELEASYDARSESERYELDRTNFLGLRYISYGVAVIGIVCFLIALLNGRNIQLTITLCEEASKVMVDLPFLIPFPLVPFAMIAVLFMYFVLVFFYLATAGVPAYSDAGVYTGLEYDWTLQGMAVYHLFGFLWTANLILAILQTTVAGSVADWYFSYQGKKLKPATIMRAFFRTIFYNLGSLAVGSFLLALVELIRIILAYVHEKIKGKSQALACLVKCLSCCMACFQRFIEFLNKHAYIMIAIYGYNFCTSARRGFGVIVSNPIQLATIHGITEFCMFLGKLWITSLTTGGAFLYLRASSEARLWFLPLIIIAIASFLIASCFMLIYDMTVSALLFCFLEDSQRNKSEDRHMSKSLEAFVSDSGGISCCCCC